MARGGTQDLFEPTDEQRKLVATLAGCGISQDVIVLEVRRPDGEPITTKTLRKYFRQELARGMEIANGRVIAKAHSLALAGNPAIVIFWLKTRCGWKEPAQDVNLHQTYGELIAQVQQPVKGKPELKVVDGGKQNAA